MSTTVPILLDLGNILFFCGSLTQFVKTYQRRSKLRDLSIYSWMIQIVASLCFCSAGLLTQAWFTVVWNGFNIAYGGMTTYWIHRSAIQGHQ